MVLIFGFQSKTLTCRWLAVLFMAQPGLGATWKAVAGWVLKGQSCAGRREAAGGDGLRNTQRLCLKTYL